MELKPIFQRVIGLDIHQAQVTACAIIGNPDGTVEVERRQFGGFKKDRRALADWCATWQPDAVVMESTCRMQIKLVTFIPVKARRIATWKFSKINRVGNFLPLLTPITLDVCANKVGN